MLCEACFCVVQGNHVCVENSMRQNCPVCFEYLFDSVRPTAVLPCGHTIHSDCLREMERNRCALVSQACWTRPESLHNLKSRPLTTSASRGHYKNAKISVKVTVSAAAPGLPVFGL